VFGSVCVCVDLGGWPGYNTFKSPHYNDSHRAFRAKVRAFMDKEVNPFVGEVRGRCHSIASSNGPHCELASAT